MGYAERRALVLDRPPAAVETVQSLGRVSVQSDVVSRDANCLVFRSKYVDRKIVYDLDDDFLPLVWELDAERRYSLVIPSNELTLLRMLQVSEAADLRRRCVLASNEAVHIALNKARTLALAAQLSIPVPKNQNSSSLPYKSDDIGFPRVLKPIYSKVFVDGKLRNLGPVVVGDSEERGRVLERLICYCDVLEQEYVRGTGVGIELLFDNGRPVWHFTHECIHVSPLTGGACSYRRSITTPRMALDFSITLLEALHWHGVAMVEFKRRADGTFVLMEINPRLCGSLALAIDAGVDFPQALLSIAEGKKLPPQPAYKIDYYARAIPADIGWMGANFFANHKRQLLLTRPRLRTFVEYLRPLLGTESWDHFDVRDPVVSLNLALGAVKAVPKYARSLVHSMFLSSQLSRHHKRVI